MIKMEKCCFVYVFIKMKQKPLGCPARWLQMASALLGTYVSSFFSVTKMII